MAGLRNAVGQSLAWAAKNVDGAIALVLAVAVGVLGVLPDDVIPDKVKSQLVSGTTLVVLALVATARVRGRRAARETAPHGPPGDHRPDGRGGVRGLRALPQVAVGPARRNR